MSAARIASLVASALLFLAPVHAQTTWVVDDDGGPGVDFTTIAAAVANASSGDRILVHPGAYPQEFATNKGLTIVCTQPLQQAIIPRKVAWRDLPRGEEVRLAGLSIAHLELEDCLGSFIATDVIVRDDHTASAGMQVTGCANVRFVDSRIEGVHPLPGLLVDTSRVELIRSVVLGGDGPNTFGDGLRGSDGCHVHARSIVSFSDTAIRGGDGGWSGVDGMFGGFGGTGLVLEGSTRVFVSCGEERVAIVGGVGGLGDDWDYDGGGGSGTINHGGWIRFSNALSYAGDHWAPEPWGLGYGGTGNVGTLDPPRPTLDVEGSHHAGDEVRLRLYGQPGDAADLLIGDDARVGTWTGAEFSLLLTVDRQVPLGVFPPEGEIEVRVDVPAGAQPGALFNFQALVSTPTGDRLTNSAPIVLR